jgi:hypothetical protein
MEFMAATEHHLHVITLPAGLHLIEADGTLILPEPADGVATTLKTEAEKLRKWTNGRSQCWVWPKGRVMRRFQPGAELASDAAWHLI